MNTFTFYFITVLLPRLLKPSDILILFCLDTVLNKRWNGIFLGCLNNNVNAKYQSKCKIHDMCI